MAKVDKWIDNFRQGFVTLPQQVEFRVMADRMTPQQRHRCMSRIHSSGTKPEIRLRRALWGRGFRYRVNVSGLPGKPDIVFGRYRTVVFVHGCFWHGHPGCSLYTVPKTNVEFWVAKVERNKARDSAVWRRLEALGWKVVIVWECQLKKAVFEETVARVRDEILAGGKEFAERMAAAREAREMERKERALRRNRDKYFSQEIKARFNR